MYPKTDLLGIITNIIVYTIERGEQIQLLVMTIVYTICQANRIFQLSFK